VTAPADGAAALLLRAARCRIASGELDRAEDLAALVLMKAADDPASRENAALARLVGAWVMAARARDADAVALAHGVLDAERGEGAGGGAARLEAHFIVWLCSPAQGKAAAVAALVSEFPGSPEALIAQGKASYVATPHWYLGMLAKAEAKSPPALVSSSTSRPPEHAKAQGDTPARRARLQVGYFSREENALRLRTELRGKGFEAEVEKTLRAGTSESRWIVVVLGGDSAAMQERLKDAGYESYTLD
ncbi:MAG: SPOR domain-containing protein, partial [Spirochaetaceae bacterium]|nr:SPOR domain-containing protein [Spirochaetaceae bacterium]